MEKTSIVGIYRSLDKSEQREAGKWLASPAHNQRKDVVDLHNYLVAGNHLTSTSALAKKRVWRKLFGKTPYDDAKLRQIIHFITRAIEEWLAYREWRDDKVKTRLSLAGQLRRRKLGKPLERTLRQVEKQQQGYPHRNEHFFRNEYLLQLEHYTNRGIQQRGQKDVRLQAVADALDNAYLIEKLRLSCNMLFHQRVSKTPYDIGLLQPIVDHVGELELDKIPALAIYYYVIMAIKGSRNTEEDGSYFSKLRTTAREHGHLLPLTEQREFYLMAINLCIPRMNAGNEAFTREAFEWYRLGMENGVLIENDNLSRYTFINVAFVAIKLEELEWTDHFIEDYQQYVGVKYRELAANIVRIRLNYVRKNYGEAMHLLAVTDPKDQVLSLICKYTQLKIYYELEEYDVLESLMDSIGAQLRRKEIVAHQKKNGQNIIRLLRALLRLNDYNKEKKEALKQEVLATQPLSEREWFLGVLG
ncbi:hypothetical protein CEQ90_03000 [Lewinellaceae bacterium SD302]|nr:hypothetical protein CEQ90_03000 [Lewinellaceae bacterium SD302]